MSFLLPILGSLASQVIPMAISWVGKKVMGSSLGNVASHIMQRNPRFQQAFNAAKQGMQQEIHKKVQSITQRYLDPSRGYNKGIFDPNPSLYPIIDDIQQAKQQKNNKSKINAPEIVAHKNKKIYKNRKT